ncbi:hypothetical protein EON65_59425, partial [archaeon]
MKANAPAANNARQQQPSQAKGSNGKTAVTQVSLPPVSANKATSPTKTKTKAGSTSSPDKPTSKTTNEKLPAIVNLKVAEASSSNAASADDSAAVTSTATDTAVELPNATTANPSSTTQPAPPEVVKQENTDTTANQAPPTPTPP